MPRTLDGFVNPQTPEGRKIHGRNVFASRLCKRGQIEEAKAYLAKHNLPYPPFAESPYDTAKKLEAEKATQAAGAVAFTYPYTYVSDPVDAGTAADEPSPAKPDVVGETDLAASVSSAVDRLVASLQANYPFSSTAAAAELEPKQHGVCDSPVGAAVEPISEPEPEPQPRPPAEVDPAALGLHRATVTGMCRNRRLVSILLSDTNERASLWADRQGYRINDVVWVRLERGTPKINAVYEEVKKRV